MSPTAQGGDRLDIVAIVSVALCVWRVPSQGFGELEKFLNTLRGDSKHDESGTGIRGVVLHPYEGKNVR